MSRSDDYQKAFKKGYADAKGRKGKNPTPPFGKSVLKGTRFMKTHKEGYNHGYRKGR